MIFLKTAFVLLEHLLLEVLAVEAVILSFTWGKFTWGKKYLPISNIKTPEWVRVIIRYLGQRLIFRIIQSLVFRVLIRVGFYSLVLSK
ncbi:MAG: hypothetical protein GKS04_03960 [Candidatus Mycalebacterium zealandia]|nr:MAG: hypothetical protein GKS04_03960 [Candidatus Mycalebacterium zealandia]